MVLQLFSETVKKMCCCFISSTGVPCMKKESSNDTPVQYRLFHSRAPIKIGLSRSQQKFGVCSGLSPDGNFPKLGNPIETPKIL